jgi:GAF domain-containing protein
MKDEKNELFENLTAQIREIVAGGSGNNDKLQAICNLLWQSVPGYDWVGYYIVDPENDRELILGPYAGEATEHVRIPFGQGICGQAADTGNIFVVDDVAREKNYLACSIKVKSEIVLPIYKDGKLVGELDLDSHQKAAFGESDKKFLENLTNIAGKLL